MQTETATFRTDAEGFLRSRGPLQWIVETILIAALYTGAGQFGQLLAIPPGNITIVWPPSGIALAAVLLIGLRAVPGIWLGAFAANGLALSGGSFSGLEASVIAAAIMIGIGSFLQPLAGAWLVRTFCDERRLLAGDLKTVKFFGVAAVMCLVSPSIGVASLTGASVIDAGAAGNAWATWWLGDSVGVLVFAPMFMAFTRISWQRSVMILAVLMVGFLTTHQLSTSFRSQAEEVWKASSKATTTRLSGTLQSWFDRTYTPVGTLAALFQGSTNISEDEFFNTIESIEESQTDMLPTAIAFLQRSSADRDVWEIKYSTGASGLFAKGTRVGPGSPLGAAVASSDQSPGSVTLSAIVLSEGKPVGAVASIAAQSAQQSGTIVAFIDYPGMIEGLKTVEVPPGIHFRLRGQMANGSGETVLMYGNGSPHPGTIDTHQVRVSSGLAQLEFNWDVLPDFQGGPETELATFALIGGVVVTVLAVLLAIFLMTQNQEIFERVRAATAELLEARDQAQASEALVRDAIESMPDAVALFDEDDKLVIFNEQYKKMAPLIADLMVPGVSFNTLMEEAVKRGQVVDENDSALKSNQEIMAEHRNPTGKVVIREMSDGRWFQVREHRTSAGGVVGIRTDITALKNAENLQSQQTAIIESTLENIGQAVVMVGPKGEILAYNRYFDDPDKGWGWPIEGYTNFEDWTADYLKSIGADSASIEASLKSLRDNIPGEWERQIPDGRTFLIQHFALDHGGYVRTYTNITEQKNVEADLRENEQKLRQLFETASEGVWEVDADTNTTAINNEMCRIIDRSPDEVIGKSVFDFVDEENRKIIVEQRERRSQGEVSRAYEASFLRPDGSQVPCLLNTTTKLTEDGAYDGAFALVTDITEQKAIEVEIAEQKAIIETILENLDQGIMMIDKDMKVVTSNRRLDEILQLEPNWVDQFPTYPDMVNHFYADIVQAPDAEDIIANAIKTVRGAEMSVSEQRIQNGRFMEIRQTPLPTGGVVRTYTDTTDRRNAEDEIKKARDTALEMEEILRDAIESISEGFVIYDENDRMIICNENYKNLFPTIADIMEPGVSFEELIDVGLARDQYGGETADRDPADIKKERMDNHRNPTGVGVNQQMADGRWMMVRERRTQSGGIAGIRADITDLKNAEEQQHRQRQIIEATLENVQMGVVMVDGNGTILASNRFFEEQFEMDIKDYPNFEDYTAAYLRANGADDEKVDAYIEMLRTNEPARWEQRIPGRRTLEITHIPQKEGGYVRTYQDISERKQAENDLKEARDAAEAGARAKSAFLATMSHEIRTPMNGVVGMVDLLMQTELDGDQRQMINTVRDSGHSLLTIINDILDFSKIEAGKLDIEEIEMSITEAVEGAAQTMAPNAVKKNVGLLTYVDPEIAFLKRGDPTRVRQILINLGGNAIKFSDAGSEVLIEAKKIATDDEGRARIRFTITDQGIGISEEAQKNLFQEFSQADESTTRKFGGTGLGLAICKRLTELMGGEIGVTSVLDEGSTFWFELPFKGSEEDERQPPAEDLSGLQVAVVSGSANYRQICRHYLAHWNAEITELEALSASEEGRRDVADTDIIVVPDPANYAEVAEIRKSFMDAGMMPYPRFVIGRDPREQSGELDKFEEVTFLDINPMRRSALATAVAVAAGRASPEVEERQIEEAAQKVRTPTAEEALEKGKLILLAEDNLTNQQVIRRQLNTLGYQCEIADDGRAAFDMWQEKPYCLLLTDCHMPEWDGFELTAAVRKLEESTDKRSPIVAITANALQGEAERCLAAGMDDYMSKPVEMKILKDMLFKWMGDGGGEEIDAETDNGAETAAQAQPEDTGSGASGDQDSLPIDDRVLKDMFGDDPETFREILESFIEPTEDILLAMRQAFDDRAPDQVKAQAHKLKSSSRAVGAMELADVCLALENAGGDDDWDVIDSLSPKVDPLFAQVKAYVEGL